jgi:hypothetical protein
MPKDKSGKFHFNAQQARHADKPSGKPTPAVNVDPPTEQAHNGGSIGHHLMSQAAESGGRHMHVEEKPEGGYTSHHVGHDGAVEGPHDHENLDALKSHMSQFFDEEDGEGLGEPVMHHGAPALHGM